MMFALLATCALLSPPALPVTATAYSPDGKTLIAGTRGDVHVLDTETGDSRVTLKGLTGRITAVSWIANNRFAVAAGEPGQSGVVTVFDVSNPKPIASWTAHKDSIFAMAVTPEGKTLATAGYDRIIKLWTLANPSQPPTELKDHSDAIYSLAIHPNGKLLASGSADRAVKVWNFDTGKRLYTLGDSTDWVYSLAWSPDGSRIAAAGVDKSLRVWKADANGGTLDRSAFAHAGPVVKLAYSDDGKTIVTAGEDRIVKVWEANTLKERTTFAAQPDAILSLAVHPKGKQIAIGRYDGTLAVLDASNGKVLQTPVPVKPVPIIVESITPRFIPRGKKTRVTIHGSELDKINSATVFHLGERIENVFHLTDMKKKNEVTADITIPATNPVGVYSLGFESSGILLFDVEYFPAVSKNAGSISFDSLTHVSVNSTLVGNLDRAGSTDTYQFQAETGQQIGIVHASKFQPAITVYGPQGEVLSESTSRSLGFVCPKSGLYRLAIRDRDFRGGPLMEYRTYLGDIPVVTGVFPPVIQKGKATTIHLSGVNLSKDQTGLTETLNFPMDTPSIDKFDLFRLTQFKNLEGKAEIAIDSMPSRVANGLDVKLPTVPYAADGVLASPGSAMTVKFQAKKGVPLVVEGLARRYGSPVDPQIEILDSAGKTVPRALIRCVAKTYLTFRDHDSTKPGLRLETWNELATNDLILIDNELIKIRQLPGHPDADCEFFAVNGIRSSFLDTTPTHHALNSPMYKVELHPPGTTLSPNGMPIVPLEYRNDDGGPGYGKDARLFFTAPEDGEYRVRLTDARGFGGPNHNVRVTVRQPAPDIKVTFTPNAPKVWKGGTLPVAVSIERLDGFDGPVAVSIADLPLGYSSPSGRIDAGFHKTTLGISATADAIASTTPIKLIAKFQVGDKVITREVVGKPVTAVELGDIVTTTKASSLSIRPGEEARFVVAVERRNGFKGRIPIDVRGLPHGVTVQNIGLNAIMITEAETEREVVLRAESWVETGSVPLIVVASREGKNAEHAAPPLMLNILGKVNDNRAAR